MTAKTRSRSRTVVGKELAKIRIDKDLSLADMARDLNMHPTHLSRVETGALGVSELFIERVKAAYSVDLSKFASEIRKTRLVFDLRQYSDEDAATLMAIYGRKIESKPEAVEAAPAPVKAAPKVADVDGVDFIEDDEELAEDDLIDLD
jgi:transcriptional regulator with XRE-family HTH domain